MQYEKLNVDALKTVIAMLFGEQAVEMVQKTYTVFAAGQERVAEASYDEGYKDGYDQSTDDHAVIEMGNDGTLEAIEHEQAVEEAVAFEADRAALNGEYDQTLVTDSGDEYTIGD